MTELDYISYIEFLGIFLELAGATVIISGAVWSVVYAIRCLQKKGYSKADTYYQFRRKLGEGILLGLEFLVAADIINSVAIEPSFQSVGVLAMVVLVRTFLSFTLEVEMTGKWPWQSRRQQESTRD